MELFISTMEMAKLLEIEQEVAMLCLQNNVKFGGLKMDKIITPKTCLNLIRDYKQKHNIPQA